MPGNLDLTDNNAFKAERETGLFSSSKYLLKSFKNEFSDLVLSSSS